MNDCDDLGVAPDKEMDAGDSRAEVTPDTLQRGSRACLEEGGLELQAVGAVVQPDPAYLYMLAGGDGNSVADHGNQVTLTTGFNAQNAEPALGIMEGDTLYQSDQRFGRWAH